MIELFNITMGNAAQFRIALTRYNEPFPVELSEDVQCNLVSSLGKRMVVPFTVGEGVVIATIPAFDGVGLYGIEIKGVLLDHDWRMFTGGIIRYTSETETGNEPDKAIDGEPYDITCEVQLYTARDSAWKLTTPRGIWGQSFDGTADVDGAMTGVTSINGLMSFGEEAVEVEKLTVVGALDAPAIEALNEGLGQAAFWIDDEDDDD